jgi:hypothetical protein
MAKDLNTEDDIAVYNKWKNLPPKNL